jgi:nicotinamidase/pyrazinamidase
MKSIIGLVSVSILIVSMMFITSCNNKTTNNVEASKSESGRNILLVVDLQKDFIDGSLCAVDADKTVAAIDSIKTNFDKLYFTLDWHPINHCSFEANGGQWPVHCVHYSLGASIPDQILSGLKEENTRFFTKGSDPSKEEYGAFSTVEAGSQDMFNANDTVVVCGIAADYCVLETLKNIISLRDSIGFNVKVFIKGTAKIVTYDTLLDYMKEHNVDIYD